MHCPHSDHPINYMQAPGISIHNLSLRYHNELIFEHLNLDIEARKTTCLLGPSGIGKTSLVRFIAGLHEPESTEINGKIETTDDEPLANRLAYLAQNDLLLPWLNTLDNITIGLRLREKKITPELQERAISILTKVGLQQAITKLPAQLSGGMRQRVALARTLFENQSVILMDEPFSALDTITRLHLQDLTAEVFKDKTVLLITHDPFEALRMGHQILIMSGKPAQLKAPLQLEPSTPRAMNNPQMSIWHAKLYEELIMSHTQNEVIA